MDFRKYILEAQRSIDAPVTGDDFDFQINETLSIECQVVEHTDDTFVIGLDQQAWDILKEADLVSEAETCMECGMGTMYVISEGMRCDACGHTMAMEAAPPVQLERAREAGIDVRRDDLGDGYFLGHYVHDSDDNRKVSYNVYHLEDPAGLTDPLANAFRDVGNLRVSPYRAKPEEIKAAAAQMKINDMTKNAAAVYEDSKDDAKLAPYASQIIDAINRVKANPQLSTRWLVNAHTLLTRLYAKDPHAVYPDMINYAYNQINSNNPNDLIAYLQGLKTRVNEAEYQGRQVTLGKPSAGDVKKYKVYVRDPKTGNTKKVNFGDKKMSIKRDNPARRKNFRARHNCADKKDRTSAGYWSCRMWSSKPVSKILKGK